MTSVVAFAAGKVIDTLSAVGNIMTDINPSTLSGAIDVIVVEGPDGNLACSPFHVRFGKLKLLLPSEKKVDVTVNGRLTQLLMKVGDAGEAFFVIETINPVPLDYATSPIILPSVNTEDVDLLDLQGVTRLEISSGHKRVHSATEYRAVVDDHLVHEPLSDTEIERVEAQNSPPPLKREWSWKWGGLPVKEDEWEHNNSGIAMPTHNNQEFNDNFTGTVSLENGPTLSLGNEDIPAITSESFEAAKDHQIDGSNKIEPCIIDPNVNQTVANKATENADNSTNANDKIAIDVSIITQNNSQNESKDIIAMSLCGVKDLKQDKDDDNYKIFEKHRISFLEFDSNPTILNDPQLVIRFQNQYYPWVVAAPMITSLAVFGKPLSDSSFKKAPTESKAYFSAIKNWWSKSPGSDKLSRSPSPKKEERKPNYAKSLRLNSDQLKSLNLKKGSNTVEFTVDSKFQGKATCTAKIFLWKYSSKIVISDVDGTITKSDVLGHMFTMVGRDWTHAGVANLYTNIRQNGYLILYLTSRAIGQSTSTRVYLDSIEQGSCQLPEGPIIMSPDRLFKSFHREVILRKPEEFKITCLRDIKKLFGDKNPNPFYAGFGNRITDALSYRSVDVPSSRIFTVDPSGELKQELLRNFKSSYKQLNDIVDQVFPSVRQSMNTEYADLTYWRDPFPAIEDATIDIDHGPSNETGLEEDSSCDSDIELPQ